MAHRLFLQPLPIVKMLLRFFRKLFSSTRSKTAPSPSSAERQSEKQGIWGERQAEHFLIQKGYRTIGRRVRILGDEIDLVMEPASSGQRPLLVFVEVKTRSSRLYGGGRAALDTRKRKALVRAVLHYLRHLPPVPFRIDLVEVYGAEDQNRIEEIVHHQAAVPVPKRILFSAAPRIRRKH